ncbi:MAG: DUF1080 domain-containing protein [Tepidisphaeraceae bacterium]
MSAFTRLATLGTLSLMSLAAAHARTITVHADQTVETVSLFLVGACIEDVNHEIYGGLYSQMIFGESFQEPPDAPAFAGFRTLGGEWDLRDDGIAIAGADGPKLMSDAPAFADGSVSVELKFDHRHGDNAGLILRTADARIGADAFTGYEVSLDVNRQVVRLGRHRDNFTLLRDVPCDVPLDRWVTLKTVLRGPTIEVFVDGKSVLTFDDGPNALGAGQVGLRVWQKEASFRNLRIDDKPIPFKRDGDKPQVSRMWKAITRGAAQASFSLTTDRPFAGRQSQMITFKDGQGEVGIANRSLNGWGMHFEAGKPYEGYAWLRAAHETKVTVALQRTGDGHAYAERTLHVPAGEWQRVDFTLTPSATDASGQFALTLKQAGSITVGHVFLQPGSWGRFKDLPVRKDVVEKMIEQGVTVLRYGGSMVNHRDYRWKNMTGPRDRRPPTDGMWYRYSTNGWAVPDFLNLCEAMGVVGVPTLNVNESRDDIADFIEYVNGSPDTPAGQRRAADGHPQPYGLKYLELGNEEHVDEDYANKFIELADVIWKKDPNITLIVGDFVYNDRITNPNYLTGTASGITHMDGQTKVLRFAKQRGREVWFDVHTWSERTELSKDLDALPSYVDAIDKLANGAKHRVVVFELNANAHDQQRALANARSVNRLLRDGRLPMVISANGLQPDGQNDNGWNQGLLFLNPSTAWLQPAGYAMQMQARSRQPVLIKCGPNDDPTFDVTASRGADGKTLVLEVVNFGEQQAVDVQLNGFTPTKPDAQVTELAGPLNAVNTAADPTRIVLTQRAWRYDLRDAKVRATVAAHSLTIFRFE